MVKITPQPIIDKFGRATQQEIAKAIGVTRPTVAAWLRGEVRTVELAILTKFSRACEVEPGEFFIVIANGNQT